MYLLNNCTYIILLQKVYNTLHLIITSCANKDQARLISPSGSFTRTDELPLEQNGNGLKTDKNTNLTEIKRERNGNGTLLPIPLYGRLMGTFFRRLLYIILLEKVYNITSNNPFSLRKKTTILAKQMKYLITTISALNQLLVITNLPTVNPDE